MRQGWDVLARWLVPGVARQGLVGVSIVRRSPPRYRSPMRDHLIPVLLAPVLVACPGRQDTGTMGGGPLAAAPEGLVLCGQAETGRRTLAALRAFEGAPVAALAGELQAELDACEDFQYRAPGLELGAGAFDCGAERPACPHLEDVLAEHAVAGSWLRPEKAAALLWADAVGDGSLEAGLRVPHGSEWLAWSPLWPAADAPGSALLSQEGAVLQARMRPDGGIAFASMVAQGSELEHRVKLRGSLFEAGANILDGTMEAAMYAPDLGQRMPPIALAFGFRVRAAAVLAMETFVDSLVEEWKVYRTPFAIPAGEGACLLDLNLMPDFAPCYVASDQALVIGWNGAALERALGGWPPAWFEERGGAYLSFDALELAELNMARTAGFAIDEPPVRYPWASLGWHAQRGPHAHELRFELTARGEE